MGPFKINLHIHLNELKLRLFYTQLVWLTLLFLSYNYKETLLYLLIKQSIFQRQANIPYFIYTDITEVFYSYLNICIFTSTYLILPLISFQIWKFVKPGLYLTEEQFWRKFLTVLSVTWITSNFLIYYKLIPCIWDFFTDVNQNAGNGYSIPLHFEAKLNEYIVFINKTYFIFNLLIIFTTIISFYLIKFTNQNLKSIKFSRKFIYILIFIVAALITPPDIASQITIALPLLMVYETIIIYLLIKKEYKNMVK